MAPIKAVSWFFPLDFPISISPTCACFLYQLFDRATVEAVLQEWFRTMADLPAGLRRAVELVSLNQRLLDDAHGLC